MRFTESINTSMIKEALRLRCDVPGRWRSWCSWCGPAHAQEACDLACGRFPSTVRVAGVTGAVDDGDDGGVLRQRRSSAPGGVCVWAAFMYAEAKYGIDQIVWSLLFFSQEFPRNGALEPRFFFRGPWCHQVVFFPEALVSPGGWNTFIFLVVEIRNPKCGLTLG